MPEELSVALRFQDRDQYNLTASPIIKGFGLLEFLNQRPLYSAELFQIYRYCKITRVDILFEVCNQISQPIQAITGFLPFVDIAGITADRLSEKIDSVRRLMSPQGGLDRVIIRKSYVCEKVIGEPVLSKYWMSNAQSLSSTPIDVNEPALVYVLANGGTAGVISAIVNYRITYHCQFFDLQTPALS
jgi:hypothetical protein